MLKNLLKTSFRSIVRNKLFSAINIIGLAVSMSLCLLVITLISEIKSYDKFNTDYQSIYRVITHRKILDRPANGFASTTLAMLPSLKEEFPEIEEVVGFKDRFSGDMSSGSKIIPLFGLFMDETFFDMFSFPLEKGNPETALKEPFSIVLTQESALKLYGEEDPIGKVLTMEDGDPYQVTGLLKPIPKNSHLKFEALTSLSTRASLEARGDMNESLGSWSDIYTSYVFIKIRDDASIPEIEDRLNKIVEPFFANDERTSMTFSLQRLDNVMVGPELSNQLGISIPPVMLMVLAVLAGLIMLTASFNYTNLSLARGIRRAKEVGVRKVIGAKRGQVLGQFLIESMLVSFLALIFGYLFFFLIRDLFLGLAPEMQQLVSLEISELLILRFVIFAGMVGLIAGIVPSMILSKIKALNALKDSSGVRLFKHVNFRKMLLIFQFTLTLIFINGTYIISKQYQFVQNFDLGYNTANIFNVALQGNDQEKVRSAFSSLPEVNAISFSQFIPSTGSASSLWVKYKNGADSTEINQLGIDEHYIPLHEFDLISGSNFEARGSSDANRSIIVNEQFLKLYQFPSADEALGEIIEVDGTNSVIRGVVRDFHYVNLNRTIGPFIFTQSIRTPRWMNMKISSTDIPATMDKIESAWNSVDPLHELNGEFFDNRIQYAYGQFSIMSKVVGFISFLAISIAALGLLGMAVYIIETKIKEVSIRKVLGATERMLISLLSKSFIWMLVIAALVALPITYLVFEQVILANFTYHTNIGVIELSIGVILIFLIALLTVGSQVYKAATSNPVDHLRTE